MAVTIQGDSGRALRNKRIVWGTVDLDGTNPTPIDLSSKLSAIDNCVFTNVRATTPGLDPTDFTYAISGTTVNLYAWKPTAAGDVTLIASTDSDDVLAFQAIGTP